MANRLRILGNTDGEPECEIEEYVELEEGDCHVEMPAAFTVTIESLHRLDVGRPG